MMEGSVDIKECVAHYFLSITSIRSLQLLQDIQYSKCVSVKVKATSKFYINVTLLHVP